MQPELDQNQPVAIDPHTVELLINDEGAVRAIAVHDIFLRGNGADVVVQESLNPATPVQLRITAPENSLAILLRRKDPRDIVVVFESAGLIDQVVRPFENCGEWLVRIGFRGNYHVSKGRG